MEEIDEDAIAREIERLTAEARAVPGNEPEQELEPPAWAILEPEPKQNLPATRPSRVPTAERVRDVIQATLSRRDSAEFQVSPSGFIVPKGAA